MNGKEHREKGEQKTRVVAFRVNPKVKDELNSIKEEIGATWEDMELIALGLTNESDMPGVIMFRTTPETFSKINDAIGGDSLKGKGKKLARALMVAFGVEEPEQEEPSQAEGDSPTGGL